METCIGNFEVENSGAYVCISTLLTWQSGSFPSFGQMLNQIKIAEQKYKSIIRYDIQRSSLAWVVEFSYQSNYLLYKSRG